MFRRARRIILASPMLRAELVGGGKQTAQGTTGISTGNSNVAIELKNGNRLVFFTRTGAGGVGVSFDVLIVDEAWHTADVIGSIPAGPTSRDARMNAISR